MPSVIMILFIVLLQHQSRASPVPNESSLNSRDLFDPASEESIAKESLNPHSYLNSRSESDTNLFATSEQPNGLTLFDDPRLTASTDDSCPISGQSRKRDGGMICPAPGSLESPSSGIFGDHNEEELDQQAELDSDGRNPIICSEILFFFGRIFDVCCDGPYGPFVIDPDVRLIYSWISDCRSGNLLPCPTQINACCRYLLPMLNKGLDCVLVGDGANAWERWLRGY